LYKSGGDVLNTDLNAVKTTLPVGRAFQCVSAWNTAGSLGKMDRAANASGRLRIKKSAVAKATALFSAYGSGRGREINQVYTGGLHFEQGP